MRQEVPTHKTPKMIRVIYQRRTHVTISSYLGDSSIRSIVEEFNLFLSVWEKKLNKAELSPVHREILQPLS
jgi:hypothetical protein